MATQSGTATQGAPGAPVAAAPAMDAAASAPVSVRGVRRRAGSAVGAAGVTAAGPHEPGSPAAVAAAAWAVDGDAGRAIRFAVDTAPLLPQPGAGQTPLLFDALASAAAADLTAARVLEAHTDALTILRQARGDTDALGSTGAGTESWGVFAAEGPGVRLSATRGTGAPGDTGWQLDGTKPWCSLAGLLSHALVTAHTTPAGADPGHRRLFAVDLGDPGVRVHEGSWVATGLTQVPSGPVDFSAVPAVPVGDDDWYLSRPGFSWGGIQVAACWWGGAVGVARQLRRAAEGRAPDQIMRAHLGAVDLALLGAGAALFDAATAIDAGEAVGADGVLLAARVRGVVARTVDEVLTRVGHALGPAPLALDARHARRVADLTLYVRQHHAERDDAALGDRVLGEEFPAW
ncbi:acyl-CoA dehydrogenase [Cryobacterium arcticum]|uniref:Acyl-CoA dehydrogenase n=1 Tax=Cryobacterium arcticum TaxID=670052 RepID=A0A1B1BFJ1_9MICO|nr:acyl-CoA dehydrogenase [Cryobacterium arcticum]ANP71256.1 Acyl-CoA dehydrogenase [Cryobacterium arcticum]